MRAHLVWFIGALGVATILSSAGPTRATIPAAPVVKCVDCEGLSCRLTYQPAYQTCTMTSSGCVTWGDCGSGLQGR